MEGSSFEMCVAARGRAGGPAGGAERRGGKDTGGLVPGPFGGEVRISPAGVPRAG